MPVHKKDGKWYWGSKGPFASKEKAREVEKAAYAHGYRGRGKSRAHKSHKGKK